MSKIKDHYIKQIEGSVLTPNPVVEDDDYLSSDDWEEFGEWDDLQGELYSLGGLYDPTEEE